MASQANLKRNDPCPCGSGKKYKHCCLTAEKSTLTKDLSRPDDRRWAGIIGSCLLLLGAIILPIFGRAGGGHMRMPAFSGTVILICAVASLIIIAIKRYYFLWITVAGSTVILLNCLREYVFREAIMQRYGSSRDPRAIVASFEIFQRDNLDWGWVVLVLAITLLIAAAAKWDAISLKLHIGICVLLMQVWLVMYSRNSPTTLAVVILVSFSVSYFLGFLLRRGTPRTLALLLSTMIWLANIVIITLKNAPRTF